MSDRPTADDPETRTIECWRCGEQRYQYESCHHCGASCKPLTKEKQQSQQPITDGGRDGYGEVVSRLKQLLVLDDDRECVHDVDGTLSPFENDPRWWRCDVCGERFFGTEAGL